ncbi:MAG: hypothetical protein LBE09_05165 [Christensenellaceae bacterium]|nr:hypothetical protein [Christensenellaceae bacterium]
MKQTYTSIILILVRPAIMFLMVSCTKVDDSVEYYLYIALNHSQSDVEYLGSSYVQPNQSAFIMTTTSDKFHFNCWQTNDILNYDDIGYTFLIPNHDLEMISQFAYNQDLLQLSVINSGNGVVKLSSTDLNVGDGVTVITLSSINYGFADWFDGDTPAREETNYTFIVPISPITLDAKFVGVLFNSINNAHLNFSVIYDIFGVGVLL